jgi:hypothetical protein
MHVVYFNICCSRYAFFTGLVSAVEAKLNRALSENTQTVCHSASLGNLAVAKPSQDQDAISPATPPTPPSTPNHLQQVTLQDSIPSLGNATPRLRRSLSLGRRVLNDKCL